MSTRRSSASSRRTAVERLAVRCERPRPWSLLVALLAAATASRLPSQEFEYAIEAPAEVESPSGAPVRYDARALLVSRTAEEGVQAWSVSVGVQGASIVEASTAGTAGASRDDAPPGFRAPADGGFEWTEVTLGDGNEGAVSAVVLSTEDLVTLPASGSQPILSITVEAAPPSPGGGGEPCIDVRLFFADGRQGSGEPVLNEVTYRDERFVPDVGGASTRVCGGGGEPRFVRGDADGSGSIDITDAIVVLQYLFLGARRPDCLDAADADDSGGVNPDITDAIVVLNWLFTGGRRPAAPAPSTARYGPEDCGADPTEDGIECRSFPPCER